MTSDNKAPAKLCASDLCWHPCAQDPRILCHGRCLSNHWKAWLQSVQGQRIVQHRSFSKLENTNLRCGLSLYYGLLVPNCLEPKWLPHTFLYPTGDCQLLVRTFRGGHLPKPTWPIFHFDWIARLNFLIFRSPSIASWSFRRSRSSFFAPARPPGLFFPLMFPLSSAGVAKFLQWSPVLLSSSLRSPAFICTKYCCHPVVPNSGHQMVLLSRQPSSKNGFLHCILCAK